MSRVGTRILRYLLINFRFPVKIYEIKQSFSQSKFSEFNPRLSYSLGVRIRLNNRDLTTRSVKHFEMTCTPPYVLVCM